MKKWLWIIVPGVIVLGLIAWKLVDKITADVAADKPRSRPAVAVQTEAVKRETIRDMARFTGTLEPAAQFIVAPKVAGRLDRLNVNIGDTVAHNQVIAVLDDAEFREQKAQAQADLKVAEAQLLASKTAFGAAKREFERMTDLQKSAAGIVTESDLDIVQARYEVAEADVKVAEAQLAQRQAALRTADVRLAYTEIRATWPDPDKTRLVGEKFVDAGAMLSANAPIVSVLDLTSVIGAITVIERDYVRLKMGQTAIITADAYPGEPFTGTIARIAPMLQENTRQARVEVAIANGDLRLKPGMFVRVVVEFAKHDDALTVPVSAIVRRNNTMGVFVVDRAKSIATFVPATFGIREGERVEVLDPAIGGEVVTVGHHLVEDGASLKLEAVAAPAQSPTIEGENGR